MIFQDLPGQNPRGQGERLSNTRDALSRCSCESHMDKATRLHPRFDLGCLVKVCFLRGHEPGREGLQERLALLIHVCALMSHLWEVRRALHGDSHPCSTGLLVPQWEVYGRDISMSKQREMGVLSLLATGLILPILSTHHQSKGLG